MANNNISDKEVLVSFGRNLASLDTDFLKKFSEREHAILALDETAVKYSHLSNNETYRISDLFTAEEVNACILYATNNQTRWFKDKRELFSYNGVYWPLLDYEFLSDFWIEVCFAYYLAERLTQLNAAAVYPTTKYTHTVQDVLNGGDAWKEVLTKRFDQLRNNKEFIFSEKIKEFIRTAGDIKPYNASPRHLLMNKEDDVDPRAYKTSNINYNPNGAVILIMSEWEKYRNQNIINDLANLFGDRLKILTADKSSNKLKKDIGDKIEILDAPMEIENPVNWECFNLGYQYLCKKIEEEFNGYECFITEINYLVKKRWPYFSSIYNNWQSTINRLNPSIVLAQLRFDPYYRIPAIVARQHGIPALGYPDGRFDGFFNIWGNQDIAVESSMCREAFYLGKSKFEQIHITKPIFPSKTYESKEFERKETKGIKIIILVPPNRIKGTGTTLRGAMVNYGVDKIINTAANVPEELKGKIDIKFKAHPGICGEKKYHPEIPEDMLINNDDDLMEQLKDTQLLVELNFSSDYAVTNALSLDIPVLFLADGYVADTYKTSTPIISQAGLVINDLNKLWENIEKFVEDENFKEELTQQAITFKNKYLLKYGYAPSIAELSNELIQKNTQAGEESFVRNHVPYKKIEIKDLEEELNLNNSNENQGSIAETTGNNVYQTFVCSDSNSNPCIYLQGKISTSNLACFTNPFNPEFLKVNVAELLSEENGEIEGFELYWRSDLNSAPINTIKDIRSKAEILGNLVNYLYNSQKNHVIYTDRSFVILQELAFQRIPEWLNIKDLFNMSYKDERINCSWSHGNLNSKNIYYNNSFKLDGWQWSTELAPFGVDALDIYLNFCIYDLNLSFKKALELLNSNSNTELDSLISSIKTTFLKDRTDLEKILEYWLIKHYAILLTETNESGQAANNYFYDLNNILSEVTNLRDSVKCLI